MFDERKYVSFYYETAKDLPKVKPDPATTAMLVVDLQNEFVLKDYGEGKMFKEMGEWDRWEPYFDRLHDVVIPNNKKLIDYFRNNSMEVTYGRIACLKNNGEDRSPVQKTPGWNGMLIPVKSFGAQMVEPLTPEEDDIVVNKTTDSVLAGTNYSQLIANMGIKTVVVTGIVTDQCVASTVRDLADEGFKVIVVEDCCAAATMELHDAELKIMNNIYCQVTDLEGVIKLLEENK
ncbi:Nicotinamidase-related amidase [Dethiosulfatibacter aminovorans DSM 17477]|uniref:Nicotinamidase-related amidase n=1 Tax=Dethiosulfatibacter aminovorans DSM 17477 TaxID=1121476 RepID=A0A1M6AT16_9FIRM|nr:cysteine hydrolase family protein [Dethiosulfatibacter aminovorans]SHI39654.1 Nicotinamidase-related amidase [Dethiosulfatibacter aminovorans DSM 17477]